MNLCQLVGRGWGAEKGKKRTSPIRVCKQESLDSKYILNKSPKRGDEKAGVSLKKGQLGQQKCSSRYRGGALTRPRKI